MPRRHATTRRDARRSFAQPDIEGEDVLKHILRANREEKTVSQQALSDNLLTFLFGGFDTTSIALTYTFWLVATHPEVERKALAEIADVLRGADPTYESAQQLSYCHAVTARALNSRAPLSRSERFCPPRAVP
jgi:cytochrome P450